MMQKDLYTDSVSGVAGYPACGQGCTSLRDIKVEKRPFRAKGGSFRKHSILKWVDVEVRRDFKWGGENWIYLKWNDRAGELGEHLKRTARQRKAVTEIKH